MKQNTVDRAFGIFMWCIPRVFDCCRCVCVSFTHCSRSVFGAFFVLCCLNGNYFVVMFALYRTDIQENLIRLPRIDLLRKTPLRKSIQSIYNVYSYL